jgi:hypothetical protein
MNVLKSASSGVQRVQRGATCIALLVFVCRSEATQRNVIL